jgi:hypothetical protein
MPLQATSGAASYDAFGGGVAAVPNYIEECFSTTLYTGNGSTQTITNGIDLAGKGGLVWTKSRSIADPAFIYDTARGINNFLIPSSTQSAVSTSRALTSFNNNGFTLGDNDFSNDNVGELSVSWTFREQPKFFDVVTYTGDGNATQTINHNLGAAPGCIIVKRTNSTGSWFVYHRSTGNDNVLFLNSTAAATASAGSWATSSTNFTVGNANLNISGATYVAYLFAHNAGGFGLTGTDNVISCGSFTTDGSGNATVNLGYEPQWILVKTSGVSGSWRLIDTMRGWSMSANDAFLNADSSAAESNDAFGNPTATGFLFGPVSASTAYIYIAIRRGPMKVPTTGTSVFKVGTEAGFVAYPAQPITGGFDDSNAHFIDAVLTGFRTGASTNSYFTDRLRGFSPTSPDTANFATRALVTSSTAAEVTNAGINQVSGVVGAPVFIGFSATGSQQSVVNYAFRRAPGFFDEVCYTGTGSARTVAHNLAAVPELMIVKERSGASQWYVYASPLGNTKALWLNSTGQERTGDGYWNNTTPTSSVFSLGSVGAVNTSSDTYVNYLFASAPGVSKVGSYTGTAAAQVINCGFTGGARFVLIKRTDDSGDWYVWDSARGIVAGNDPYLLLNSTAAEVTSTDYIDTAATGFEITSTAPAAINASGGSFIFLAIS